MDAIYRHYFKAPRRLLYVQYEANRFQCDEYPVPPRPAERTFRGMREGRDENVLLSFDHGLASPRLPPPAHMGNRPSNRRRGHQSVCTLHEKRTEGPSHELWSYRRALVRWRMGNRLESELGQLTLFIRAQSPTEYHHQ